MKNEYGQWRKLDNAALAFPAVTGKNDTRVFRFYCELKEEIKEERNKLTELLKNGELKKAEKALDAYFKLLAKAVNEERGMNE